MRIFQSATTIVCVSLMLISIPMILPAQVLSQILETQTERTLIAQESQVRVDKVVTQTRSMEDQYRANLKEIDGLRIYNKLLELQIENQERVKVDLEQSIANVAIVNRQIVPVMTRMIDSLEQFISLDVPFLNQERTDRVEGLKELMSRQDLTVAKKFRKGTEA